MALNGTEDSNLWLFSGQRQEEVVVPKKHTSFEKNFLKFNNFLQTLTEKGLGSVLFSRDGRVTATIHFSFLVFHKLIVNNTIILSVPYL